MQLRQERVFNINALKKIFVSFVPDFLTKWSNAHLRFISKIWWRHAKNNSLRSNACCSKVVAPESLPVFTLVVSKTMPQIQSKSSYCCTARTT